MWRDRVARPVRRCSRGTEDSALDSDSVDVFQIVFDRLEVVEPLPSQGDIDAPGARDLVSSAAGLSVLPKIFSAIQPPQFCAVIGHAGLYTGIHLAQPAALATSSAVIAAPACRLWLSSDGNRYSPDHRHQHRRHHSGDLQLGGQIHGVLRERCQSQRPPYTRPWGLRCDVDHAPTGSASLSGPGLALASRLIGVRRSALSDMDARGNGPHNGDGRLRHPAYRARCGRRPGLVAAAR
jgi:hypothetical protein